MKAVPFFLLLTLTASLTLRRLESWTTSSNILFIGDEIMSALGLYKLILEANNCQLTIYRFEDSNNSYIQSDIHRNSEVDSCSALVVKDGRVETAEGAIYASLISQRFDETWLSIDDSGNIRLIGKGAKNSFFGTFLTEQIIIKEKNTSHNRVNIYSQAEIYFQSLNRVYTNKNGWNFQISNNELRIHRENFTFQQSFSLEGISLTPGGLYDPQNSTPPFTFFQETLKLPRCKVSKANCQVRAPYTIEFNLFWPTVRVYDQDRYIIAEYSYREPSDFQKFRVCPPATFLYRDECRKNCPLPYIGEVQMEHGECVLQCEEGTFYDQQNRRCSCSKTQLLENQADKKLIKKCQRQWKEYLYGCDCSTLGKVYDAKFTLSCQQKCPAGTFADIGLCLQCGQNCQVCVRDTNYFRYLACKQCQAGYELIQGRCQKAQQQCQVNCLQCKGDQCTKCTPFYSLKQGNCFFQCGQGFTQLYDPDKGSYCLPDNQTQGLFQPLKCGSGCLACTGSNCKACANGYVLFISPLASTCKLKSSLFHCEGTGYIYDNNRQVCYAGQPYLLKMDTCLQKVENCQLCQKQSQTVCVFCQPGYILHQNKCVMRCPSGFSRLKGVCTTQIDNCALQSAETFQQEGIINWGILQNSQVYKRSTFYGLQPGNNQAGYSLYTRQYLLREKTENISLPSLDRQTREVCLKCRRGYGLNEKRNKCEPCPSSCEYQHCYFAREDSCYKPTIKCTFLDENDNCLESCPEGRYPLVDSNNQTRCLLQTQASVNDYLKIDASSFIQDDGTKVYFFVLNKPVQELSTVQNTLVQSRGVFSARLLVASQDVARLEHGQYYQINQTSQNAVALVFDEKVNAFRTSFGFTLANSVYGAEADYTHNQWMKEWLALVGYLLSWVVLLVHALYVGNGIMYKTDNLIIFCQTIYFFSFVKLLVGNSLAQFYYGWFWMHMGFFPNYFADTIPNQYVQREAPLSYKLSTLDANFIRNTGFSLSLFLTFLVAYTLVLTVILILAKIFHKTELWYQRVARNAFLSCIELLSMLVFYFSVAQLLHGDEYPQKDSSFHDSNVTASIVFIILISLYTLVRLYFNPIGGLYMLKRLVISLILVDAYEVEGYLALLVAFEIIFCLLRYRFEGPAIFIEKAFVIGEGVLFIAGYFLLFLVIVAGVNVIMVTLIIFMILLILVGDLVEVYLDSRNEFLQFDFLGQQKQCVSKAEEKHDSKMEEAVESERKMNL